MDMDINVRADSDNSHCEQFSAVARKASADTVSVAHCKRYSQQSSDQLGGVLIN
jgi:hypothetical protein